MNKPEFDKLWKRPRILLDVKGLLMNAWHTGKDPDAVRLPNDKMMNTAGYAIQVVLDKFILPALNNTFQPLDVIAVWEGGNHYRKTLFPKYKERRTQEKETMLPRVKQELDMLEKDGKRLLAYMGIVNVWVDGLEGDDVIAAFCQRLKCKKIVYTNDSDMLQLQDKDNAIFLVGRDGVLEDGEYEDTLFHHLALRKSIVGDPTDEYPGVEKMGPVAWAKLKEAYGEDGLDELLSIVADKDWNKLNNAVVSNPECKLLQRLWDSREEWAVQYQLAVQHPELCWGFRGSKKVEPTFYTRPPVRSKCLELLSKLGIIHMIDDLEPFFGINTLVTEENAGRIKQHLESNLLTGPIVSFDYETYDELKHPGFLEALSPQARHRGYVDVLSQRLTGASFTYGANLQHSIYIPILHKQTEPFPELLNSVMEKIQAARKPLCAHNASFEEQVTKQCLNMQLYGMIDTSTTQSYVDEETEVGLKDLTKAQLGMSQTEYSDLLVQYGAEDMRGITGQEVLTYALEDAIGSAHLWKLHSLIMELEGSAQFYYENEAFVVHSLNRSFETGKKIDYAKMAELAEADEKLEKESREKMVAMLMEHCTEEKPDCARHLFDEDYDYLKTKYRAMGDSNGWSREKVKAKLREIELNYQTATVYHPYRTVQRPVEVTGTPGEVATAAKSIGLPALDALTTPKVTAWAMGLSHEERKLPLVTSLTGALKNLSRYRKLAKADKATADAVYPECAEFIAVLQDLVQKTQPLLSEGDELNFESPKQMLELFYLKLGLPVRERVFPKRGSFRHKEKLQGAPSTNDEAVEAAKLYDCPEGDWRREFLELYTKAKEANTRHGLYYRPYPHWRHPRDGVIHPGIINCGTATRRPTGTSPNILQVSKGDVRTIFVPRYEGHCIVTADFNGQELRLTGSESNDPVLIGAYVGLGQYVDSYGSVRTKVKDIHSVTARTFAKRIVRNEVGAEAESLLLLDDSGFVDYEFFVTVRKLKDNSEDIPALGSLTQKIRKAFETARKMAKVVNFLIIYGGNHRTLAKKLGLPEDFAELLMNLVFQAYARLAPWQREVIDRAIRDGYVTTAYGNWKHVSPDLRSKDRGLRQRAERQTVNFTIQACLQAGSLVSTDSGLRSIETLVGEVFEVDTGFGFFTATAVYMGKAPAATITTSSGLQIKCDNRHRLKGVDHQWLEFSDLKPGVQIALPSLENREFSTSDYDVDWPFIVGYWLGDGSLTTRRGSRPTDTHFRTTLTLVGGETKKELLKQMQEFLITEGIEAKFSEQYKSGYPTPVFKVLVNRKRDIQVIRERGITESTARTKTIPNYILRADIGDREQFLRGFLLADGARRVGYRVHTPNLILLRQLQVLGATLGLDSTQAKTANGFYSEFSNGSRRFRKYPSEQLNARVSKGREPGWRVPTTRKDLQSVANRRALEAKVATQKVAERLLKKYAPTEEVYRFDSITHISVRMNEQVDTYTLSVDHPLHQFVADGVIHKNCAADILKIVLREALEKRLFEDLGATLIAPVYDEIAASVPIRNVVEYCNRLQPIMNLTPPGHPIPMLAEICVGKNWGDVIELGDNPCESVIEKTLEECFA